MNAPPPKEFPLGQPLRSIEEDGRTEFKEPTGQNPARRITDDVEDYLVGFLNGNGGRILWGIRDRDRVVVGVSLDAAARNEVRKGVACRVHNIDPKVDPSCYRVEFHPVVGAAVDADLCLVEVAIDHVATSEPFYNQRGDAYIRLNGVNQKLRGPKLTAWIKTRLQAGTGPIGEADDPKVLELAQRVRRIFSEHGLEPGHLARFFELRKAPFTICLGDLKNDAAFLHWLDETKIDWIAHMFLIRREWIDGEDARIHEEFQFDKQPERFFSTVSQHVDALIWEEVHDNTVACFLRRGVGRDWKRNGQYVFFVLAVPIARFSSERTIFKYITDQLAYPWESGRTNVQLRAWARLLDINKRIYCSTSELSLEVASKLESNSVFLRDVIENHRVKCRDDWHIEDYGLYRSESTQAKVTERLPEVIEFLKTHNLPSEQTTLGPTR